MECKWMWKYHMRISCGISPVQITKDQKQLKNVEYFHSLGSVITNDARCTREIKFRISMAKTAFNKLKTSFTSKVGLHWRKKLATCYIWIIALVWCWNLDTSEGGSSEMSGNFLNVVLEKFELDWSCEKWRSVNWSQRGKEYPTHNNKQEVNWIGHISRRNCRLKHVIEGKIEERTDGKTRENT